MITGAIDDYVCYDLDEMALRDLITLVKSHIIGMMAVNTSWDSGILKPSETQLQHGWTRQGHAAVTPPIDDSLISSWPVSHDDYCDEWWFFHSIPPAFDFSHGFCNMVSQRIGQWEEVEFCTHLAESIQRFGPELVLGNGKWTYCVSKRHVRELDAQPSSAGDVANRAVPEK